MSDTKCPPVHECPQQSGHVRPLSPPLGGTGGQSRIKRNDTARVWRVRALDPQTQIVKRTQLFHQLYAAKRRGLRWQRHGFDVTLELSRTSFEQVWP